MGLIEEVEDGDTDYVFELMLEDKQTESGRRRRIKQRKQRKKYTKNRFY